ncbi:MAG: hypothetical protein ACJAXU_001560 [Paracoccaceae bacterium]|jgi:hypothetical protein
MAQAGMSSSRARGGSAHFRQMGAYRAVWVERKEEIHSIRAVVGPKLLGHIFCHMVVNNVRAFLCMR